MLIPGLVGILVFIIVATVKLRMHPFVVLIISAVVMGFFSGMVSSDILQALTTGFGKTTGSIGIIIALGASIGVFLEKSGATGVLANAALRITGKRKPALALNITGFIVSIPVFCDSGFMVLSSLIRALNKKTGVSVLLLAIALATGLYATHVFVPPTPGPLAAASILQADLGQVMFIGFLVALPVSLAGYLWASFAARHTDDLPGIQHNDTKADTGNAPGIIHATIPIVLPIVLIALRSVADYPTYPLGQSTLYEWFVFTGNPVIALFIGFLYAFIVFRVPLKVRYEWLTSGLLDAGMIILITGAGGAFGYVLQTGGFGDKVGDSLSGWHLGIILPFLLSAILKTAQGSSTVAIITTAAVIAPLTGALGLDYPLAKALTVVSIGAGAMTVSHLNDSYFWVVTKFSGLDVKTAIRSFTLATLIQGIIAILIIWGISMFVS